MRSAWGWILVGGILETLWASGMKLSDFLMYTDMSDYTSEYKLE